MLCKSVSILYIVVLVITFYSTVPKMFAWLKEKKALKLAAGRLYQRAVVQSRNPFFYKELDVADTIDGRFDLVCLHVFIILERVACFGRDGRRLSQALFDQMFRDMEETLREIGVGDLSVPKHMKRMMKLFNGRLHIYKEAIDCQDRQKLEKALSRNVYRSENDEKIEVKALATYVLQSKGLIERCSLEDLSGGEITFPDMQMFQEKASA